MQVGIDTYCYHRLYAEVRNGELPARIRWTNPLDAVNHAWASGADWLFFQTHLLAGPESLSPVVHATRASELKLGLSWGGAAGFDGGRAAGAENDLADWLQFAGKTGIHLMRIVVGGPPTRAAGILPARIQELVGPLRRMADASAELRIRLAIENHGDLGSQDLDRLIALVARSNLGACIDNVNLIRVGDDMLEGVRRLARRAFMVHLKDCTAGDPTVPGGPVSTALGEGIVDVAGILQELSAARFSGPLCVEFGSVAGDADELAMVERSVRWLRSELKRQDLSP